MSILDHLNFFNRTTVVITLNFFLRTAVVITQDVVILVTFLNDAHRISLDKTFGLDGLIDQTDFNLFRFIGLSSVVVVLH